MFHHCEISDSFVHPDNKLANGKQGHGEETLFISNNKNLTSQLLNKKWKITVEPSYLKNIKKDIEELSFIKKINRYENIKKNLNDIENKQIQVYEQNGKKDVNRNYVGIKEKTDKQIWTCLRRAVIPTKTTLQFIEKIDYIEVIIIHNNNIKKYNILHGCSFISLEAFKLYQVIYNIEIQTAQNKGEFKLRNPKNGYMWPVDGYHNCSIHNCSGTSKNPCKFNNCVWEFQGDYWHKNKKYKDIEKKIYYESQGFIMEHIYEYKFNNHKKLMREIQNYKK